MNHRPHDYNAPDSRSFKDKWRVQIQGCVVAAALCAVITLIAMQWLMAFDAANLVMLYLLGVVVVALFYGRWPSVVATVINVVSFDLFLSPHAARSPSLMCNIADLRGDVNRRAGDREPYCWRALSGAGSPLPRANAPAALI
ncbi:DUF4118 domain-containing protein [Escherichia coli]|uniref:DUF4118 domain-containing protein n=1 Tax=Escherichia coli TaxID=562 RepID=UPI003CC91A9E